MKLREPEPITDYTHGGDCPRVTLDGPEPQTQASYLGSAIFNRANPANPVNPAELTDVEYLRLTQAETDRKVAGLTNDVQLLASELHDLRKLIVRTHSG